MPEVSAVKSIKVYLILIFALINLLPVSAAESDQPVSVFNSCIADQFPQITYRDLFEDWFTTPVSQGQGMFNPVYLKFEFENNTENPDSKQPLTFPCLLSYKFEFVPDNFSARHPAFVFRRDSTVLTIKPEETEKISSYISSWSATHAIAGKLIETDTGYGGTLKIFDKAGSLVFTQDYGANLGYFELMGKMVNDWMEFRKQPVSEGLYQELIRPMTQNMETVKWYGEGFDVAWRSQAEWDIYERILKSAPEFGEVRHWYTSQKGWETGERQETERGKALLDHPVMVAIQEFSPKICSDQNLVDNYRTTVNYMMNICPENPTIISAYLHLYGSSFPRKELEQYLPLVIKYPCNYYLLYVLDFEYKQRFIYDKSIPLYLSAIFSGWLPGDGNFDAEYSDLGYEYWMLGLLPESLACITKALAECTGNDDRAWNNLYIGHTYRDSFSFSQAASAFREKARLHPGSFKALLSGYMSLYEGRFLEAVKEWENAPLTQASSAVLKPFLDARQAIAAGDSKQALQLLEVIPFDPYQGDKYYQLEAEIIRADALLLSKDKQAEQHAFQAWYMAPRSRRTAYLVEKVLEKDNLHLARFAEVAQFLFPEQTYWTELRQRVQQQKALDEKATKIRDEVKKLVREKEHFQGRVIDFWLKQPPFLVEYYALKLTQSTDLNDQIGALNLYQDYMLTLQDLSEAEKVHTRNFLLRLLKITKVGEGKWGKWLNKLEADNDSYIQYQKGEQKKAEGDDAAALECFQQALTGKNDNPDIYNIIGNILYSQKEYQKASEAYEKAILNSFDGAYLLDNLGNTYYALGQYSKAVEAYQKATDINSQNAKYYYHLGRAENAQNNNPGATEAYRRAIELDPEDSDTYNNLGNIYYDQKRYPEALELYQKALGNAKQDYVYFNLGHTYQTLKRYNEAIEAYQNALNLNPNYAKAFYHLGETYTDLNQRDNAVKSYQEAVRLQANYEDAYFNLGVIFKDQKKYPEALGYYQKALECNPNNVETITQISNIYYDTGRSPEAEEFYRKALAINPRLSNVWYNLGNTYYYKMKKYSEAIAAYQKTIEIDPKYYKAYYNLGNIYYELKRFPEAIEFYRQVTVIQNDNYQAFHDLGNAYYQLGKYPEAIQAHLKALEISPDYANGYNSLGIVYAEQKQYPEALAAYQKAVSLKPDFTKAYYNMGNLYKALQEYDQAITCYLKAIECDSKYIDAYNNLGRVYSELDQYYDALRVYQKAILINPQYSLAYYNLGFEYSKHKKYNEAVSAYRKAIELKPDYFNALYQLGKLFREMKQFEEAIKTLTQALQYQPNDVNVLNELGICYYSLGKCEEAIGYYRKSFSIKPLPEFAYNIGISYSGLKRYSEAVIYLQKAVELNSGIAVYHYQLGIAYIELKEKAGALKEVDALKNLNPKLAEELMKVINERFSI